jgi:hypothetical protein
VLRLTGLGERGGTGVTVAVASGSESWDCKAPHEGQNLEEDSTCFPQEAQVMEESRDTMSESETVNPRQ